MEKQKAILKIESYSSKDGMLLLHASDHGVRAMLKSLVELCTRRYGSYVKLEMSPPYPSRSLDQNSKYWAMCTEYGLYLGETKERVSLGVKHRAMEEGLWEGEEVPFLGHKVKVPVSTAVSDVRQMSVLIEVLYRIAAEDGYVFES